MTERARLDWRLDSEVWSNVVEYGESEYGENAEKNGYLVRVIEEAMREVLEDNRLSELEEKVYALIDEVGAKKEDVDDSELDDEFEYDTDAITSTTRVVKQVDAALLRRWKRFADQFSDPYGVLLSKHLEYYLWGGQPRTLTRQVDRALEEIEREQDDSMTTAEEIADRLDERFTLDEFHQAAEAAGVGTKKYATKQYLPKVLDELDVYPHPGDEDLFIPISSATIPDTPDPATLPYQAMDDDDKRLALKTAALRMVGETSTGLAKFSATDGVDALGGRPRHSTVRPLLRDIARESEGFVYDDDIPGLRVDRADAVRADYDNEAALDIVGWLKDDTADSDLSVDDSGTVDEDDGTEDVDTTDEWVEAAVDLLEDVPADVPDTVVDNKIVRARWPDDVDEVEGPPDELLERVTDDDRQIVKERLGWTDEPDEADHRDAVAEQWDALEEAEAERAMTDGGVVEGAD